VSAPASKPTELVDGFSPKVVLALLLAGVFAAACFLVVSAYEPELRATRSGGGHAESLSGVGYAGIVRLTQLMGQPIQISRSPSALNTYPGLLILTPTGLDQLRGLAFQRTRLLVLPKWATAPDPDHIGWEIAGGELPASLVLGVLPRQAGAVRLVKRGARTAAPVRLDSKFSDWPEGGVALGPISSFQTLEGGNLKPLVVDEHGRQVLGLVSGTGLYVLSDPDLLDTQGIRDPRTARAALAILSALRDPQAATAFDVSLNGLGGEHSLLRLAFEPPFVGATLCLVIVAALVGGQAWNRFGPVLRPGRAFALGKTALVQNGASMARLARREPHMAGRYVQLCRQRAAAALGAAHLQGEALDQFLDRWSERIGAPGRITGLAAEAREVRTTADLTALARRARQWRLEMTREPG
jgi:hypothetical protein